ncbi:hypothetical protein BY458DRAFT_508058 [Sporodiniella umbellata]|nr:hypothetical protein BY458DRAFT_508058 [Sporodiniella umbellata]
MTAVMKPTIKLPPHRSNSISVEPKAVIHFGDPDDKIADEEVKGLLEEFGPFHMKRERGSGYLSFVDPKIAEKVYAFYNGYVFSNNAILKLSLNSQTPEGPLLEIRGLPVEMDHHQLYDLCRPLGVLHTCKIIKEEGAVKKKALVQYFAKKDSETAQHILNGKSIESCTIQVNILMPSHLQQLRLDNNTGSQHFVDYMNLYVKNLDPSIGNTELFDLFRKYGRIVSARVMSNPATGLSKGYGFVSFSKHEEAASALEEMNGQTVLSKPMAVAYHEPKKPRQEKSSSSTTTSSFHSPPTTTAPVDFHTVSYFETRHPHEKMIEIDPPHLKEYPPRKLSFADIRPSLTHRPSLASLANYHNPLERVPEEQLARKGSVESVMTESTAHVQRIRMTDAIQRYGLAGSDLKTVTSMLLTLKKRERSLCLFNPEFLKEKIHAAMDALEVFDDEEEDEEEEQQQVIRRPSIVRKPSLPRPSRAIPIVAPQDKALNTLLNSFHGKPLYEKKQLLGDQLFPLVKATGVRHAPKITIRLLDTIELEDLAKLMLNKEQLKAEVQKIA